MCLHILNYCFSRGTVAIWFPPRFIDTFGPDFEPQGLLLVIIHNVIQHFTNNALSDWDCFHKELVIGKRVTTE